MPSFSEDPKPEISGETLESWIMDKAETWKNHYQQNYKPQHDEYWRLWRGIWAAEDKTRTTERSRIISPALQQAVESNVAEVEEATFGRGDWFDIKDDDFDKETKDIQILRKKLHQDFKVAKVKQAISECILNSAIYGTGIAEIVVGTSREMAPATESVMDGQMKAVGVNITERTLISLKPVLPKNFLIEPNATSIEESLATGVDEFVPLHGVEELQEAGIYRDGPISQAPEDIQLEHDESLSVFPDDKVRLTRWYGKVPTELLKQADGDVPDDHEGYYIDAIVVIANEATVLKADANPFMMEDSSMISFSWDLVPSSFWGRGVCEKGYNSQKALDAEIRARIDALALTVHPMLAMDATRVPRGTKPEIRAGKILLTNGPPQEVIAPFKFGNVEQISFAQAAALQQMVQQATGAMDTVGLSQGIGDAKTGAVSMSLGAILKRHKRTLINFQESFLIPFVSKAAWRYMQLEPDFYPVKDYKFNTSSSLGIMAREYEVSQLVQLMQTMGPESPIYLALVESVIENMSLSNREDLLSKISEMGKPNKSQQETQKAALAFQKAQTGTIEAQGKEFSAKAIKAMAEAQAVPRELEIKKIDVSTKNLKDGESDDKEFERRLKVADLHLREKQIDLQKQSIDHKKANDQKVLSEINES